MVVAGEIWIKLGLDPEDLRFGIDKAKYSMLEWRQETNANTLDMAKWGSAVAAAAAPYVAVAYAINAAADAAGDFGNAIKDSSRAVGMSTTEYQQWRHVAVASGADADAFTASIRMMSVRMKEAADPTSAMGKQLKSLNVEVVDSAGHLKSTNAVLTQTVSAISKLPEGFERNQASMEVFGRSWAEIAPILALNNEEIAKLKGQAPVISEEDIAKQAEFHTQQALMNEEWERTAVAIGTEVIPVVQDLTEDMTALLRALAPVIEGLGVLGDIYGWARTVESSSENKISNKLGMGDVVEPYGETTSGGVTGTSISKSKALYASRHPEITQINNYNTVALTAEQTRAIGKQNNRDLGTQASMMW